MGMKELLANAHKRASDREIKKLLHACESGSDMNEALIVSPLSDLDIRKNDGWVRPDGLYYEDYIIESGNNLITFLIDSGDGPVGSCEKTIQSQIDIDTEYRDWQEPSGSLYED